MNDHRFAALILAAGRSRRMGAFKPLLEVGGKTVVERLVGLFQKSGVDDVSVVVGHESEKIEAALKQHRVQIVMNHAYQEGMYSSVVAGVESLGDGCSAFFVMPSDIPLVRPATIQRLLLASKENPGKIIRPRFRGRRGHPPLIPSTLKSAILCGHGHGGLRKVLRDHGAASLDIEVTDRYIMFDINRPDDYAELKQLHSKTLTL
jgi:CTP:molybdopterin cytidylyltransferase MocA